LAVPAFTGMIGSRFAPVERRTAGKDADRVDIGAAGYSLSMLVVAGRDAANERLLTLYTERTPSI
jgi:hypothetical protein